MKMEVEIEMGAHPRLKDRGSGEDPCFFGRACTLCYILNIESRCSTYGVEVRHYQRSMRGGCEAEAALLDQCLVVLPRRY